MNLLRMKSTIEGVAFPSLPSARGCQLLALQWQLDRTQWIPDADLREIQGLAAYRLFQHAIRQIPFYGRSLSQHGLSETSVRSISDWLRVPLLRRSDVQGNAKDLKCRPVGHGKLSTSATTGSSGSPVVVIGTAVNRIMWHALTLRHHLWHKRDLSAKMATIRTIKSRTASIEQRQDNWGGATVDLFATGPLVALDVSTSVDEQASWLVREDPEYLLTYPSVALAIAEYMTREGMRLPKLRELATFGELLDPRLRQLARDVWGVPVVDGYSSQEVGYIALQCPETENYHVQSESLLVEVLDDDGNWCSPGQVGRVVVTTLHNFAMPLIRYEIGDYAEVGEPCPCGRGLPVLRRIVGRKRNMAVLPDGRVIWPCMDDRLLLSKGIENLPPIRQFQLIQTELDAVTVRLVAGRTLLEDEEKMIVELVQGGFGWPMRISFDYVDMIARGPGGKFEDFRCDVAAETLRAVEARRQKEVTTHPAVGS